MEKRRTLSCPALRFSDAICGRPLQNGRLSRNFDHRLLEQIQTRYTLPLPSSKFSHMDVQHFSGWLDQGILIPALPLDFPTHLAIRYAVYRFPILNGGIMLQYVRRRIIGMVHHPIRVHVVEVVLEIWQEQGTHAHCIDEHILGTLNVEEADIDAKTDEPIRAFDLMGTHILRQ